MRELKCALVNLNQGGWVCPEVSVGPILNRGFYSFERLQKLMAPTVGDAPHLITVCEGWRWGEDGQAAALFAAHVLSDQLGRPYVPLVGWLPQIPSPPVVFYDAAELALEFWGDRHHEVLDRRNLAVFHPRGRHGAQFQLKAAHWPYASGAARLEVAKGDARYGTDPRPTLYAGDFNGIPSGPHLTRHWDQVPEDKKPHKGKQIDGVWVPDTDALDYLLGPWVGGHDGKRTGNPLFHACEEAFEVTGPEAEKALIPTVNTGPYNPGGSGLLIDWALHNRAWQGGVVRGSVRVEIPPPDRPPPSDHRLKLWTMELSA